MEFYESIARFYNDIFPLNKAALTFISSCTAGPGKEILDIGCSTGQLSSALAESGNSVKGIDLDREMIKLAKESHPGSDSNLDFAVENMMELDNNHEPGTFDSVLCTGNTLVHLQSSKEIGNFIKSVYSVLKPEGVFILQILNYDNILDNNITELPLIENDAIRFIRKYSFEDLRSKILFSTELLDKATSREIKNKITLYPLRSAELDSLLRHAGFSKIDYYGNFKGEPLMSNSLPLVAVSVKI